MGCVDRIGKNPIAVRVVTNVVLMISDADVVFSFLFLYSLGEAGQEDGLYYFFLAVIIVGILTYVYGTLVLAPRQKRVIPKLVLKFMGDNPSECVTNDWMEQGQNRYVKVANGAAPPGFSGLAINKGMPVSPIQNQGMPHMSLKLADLDPTNKQHSEALRLGLVVWGLGAIWDAQEMKNAWNCAEMKHGIPFYRLARFGFMAQPTPKDLGSILNMNALYSFSTGTLQLIFGILLLTNKFTSEDELDTSDIMASTIPLSISFLSLILSVVNVVFDFAGKLAEAECERRMSDAIIQKKELTLREGRLKIENDHKDNLRQVEEEHKKRLAQIALSASASPDDVELVESSREAQTATLNLAKEKAQQTHVATYAMALNALENQNLTILDIELRNYRAKKQRIQQILLGLTPQVQNEAKAHAVEAALRIDDVKQQIKNNITQWYEAELGKIAAQVVSEGGGMSAADLKQQKDSVDKEYSEKLAMIQ